MQKAVSMPDSRNYSDVIEEFRSPKNWLSPAGIWLSDKDRNQLEMSISSFLNVLSSLPGIQNSFPEVVMVYEY